MNAHYVRTVQLLLSVAQAVFDTPVFAMKGGTALNLFLQDMPRLSVDIDVVFVPHTLPRDEALRAISEELAAVQARIEALGFEAVLRKAKEGNEAKLFVRSAQVEVKVEVNFVFRGTVLPPERRSLSPATQRKFSANVEVPVLAPPELYASKLVAALDRQHPRDLFDMQLMLASGGWNEALLDCFVVYLAGHHRPLHEVLSEREAARSGVRERVRRHDLRSCARRRIAGDPSSPDRRTAARAAATASAVSAVDGARRARLGLATLPPTGATTGPAMEAAQSGPTAQTPWEVPAAT
jgi:hypothetical protein